MAESPGRVLIVEDSPLNMELATDLLETAGYAVLQAGDAERGFALLRTEPVDIVLMDMRLPGMDGIAAVRAIRGDPRFRPLRVVALTAQAMRGDREVAVEAGFDGYISKPIDTRTFVRTVEGFMRAPAAS